LILVKDRADHLFRVTPMVRMPDRRWEAVMSVTTLTRRAAAGAMIAGLLALSACAPVTVLVDTPKEGDAIAVAPKQPMQVRWANLEPDAGSWTLEQPPKGALQAAGVKIQPPAAGARQLEVFNFVGVQKGEETLTFAYKRKNGAAPNADERITVKVSVA
jgi:hypothetical protein